MKRTTVQRRREKSKTRTTRYSDKIEAQKAGIYKKTSPFKPTDPSEGGKNRFDVAKKANDERKKRIR